MRYREHEVALADAESAEGQLDGVRAVAHADGVLRGAERGEAFLELPDLFAVDVPAAVQRFHGGPEQGFALVPERRAGIRLRNEGCVHNVL